MNWFRSRRYFRDEIVQLLDKEAGGSFATLSKALENVTAKHPPNSELSVDEVIQEIKRINKYGDEDVAAALPKVRKAHPPEMLKTG
jgi:hypothetical protein